MDFHLSFWFQEQERWTGKRENWKVNFLSENGSACKNWLLKNN